MQLPVILTFVKNNNLKKISGLLLFFIFIIFSALGIVPSPFDCSQVSRSLKTLEVRMKQHMISGLAVAKFLESHPQVTRVFHPRKNY